MLCACLFAVGLGSVSVMGGAGCNGEAISCPAGQVACGSVCVASGTVCPGDGQPDQAVAEDPSLAALTTTVGQLSPAFSSSVTTYTLMLPAWAGAFQVQATPADSRATLTLNGGALTAGALSMPVAAAQNPTPIDITVRAPGGTTRSYTVVVMRSPSVYVKASNTGAGDLFGSVVALSGDTLAVGAPAEDSNATGVGGDASNNGATNSGAVFVFLRSSGVWTQQAYIKASNTGGNDQFGTSVAFSGSTLVAGGLQEDSNAIGIGGSQTDNSAQDSGAVYVY